MVWTGGRREEMPQTFTICVTMSRLLNILGRYVPLRRTIFETSIILQLQGVPIPNGLGLLGKKISALLNMKSI